MSKLQTVYIPIKENSVFKIVESGIIEENCYPQESFVFTQEELKQLLQDYTDRIIENVELITCDIEGSDTCDINVDSIKEQLAKFLKENGYE